VGFVLLFRPITYIYVLVQCCDVCYDSENDVKFVFLLLCFVRVHLFTNTDVQRDFFIR
jgi:hypothetical protein